MLDEYDRAREHSRQQPVQTHHGVIGEAAVRNWLAGFLPKRYGVCAGHMRSQGLPNPHQTRHFDVIIYDQLEAPILWIEGNKDKSDSGQTRIIPTEFVRAVIEVKSCFNGKSVREAAAKLAELKPLTDGIDDNERFYPKYLRQNTLMVMLFFDLRTPDQSDLGALDLVRDFEIGRPFYGAVILRGRNSHGDDTGLIQKLRSDTPIAGFSSPEGLCGTAMSASTTFDGQEISAFLSWSDVRFADFAFDLVACLKGTFRHGYASSLHGLDISTQS